MSESVDITDDILDFLFLNYGNKKLETSIVCIAIYGSGVFHHIERFKSWWFIENIAFAGKSPATMSEKEGGFECVMQHLVGLSYGKNK